MATYDPTDRDRAILWSKNVIANKENYLICDTETTGLGFNDEIVQIAIIDLNKNVLLNTLVKPYCKKSMSRSAYLVHGIKMKDLSPYLCFNDICLSIQKICEGKTVLFFNANYDMRLMDQSSTVAIQRTMIPKYDCIMLQYSKFIGTWNDYHNDYKYQRLSSADHSALGDCLAALKVLERMTHGKIKYIDSKKRLNPEIVQEKSEIKTFLEIPAEKKSDHITPTKWWQFWN